VERSDATTGIMAKSIRARRRPPPAPIYQIKVTLKQTKPPIWRRLLIQSDLRLDELHEALQLAFGWQDSHLHQFIVGREIYGDPAWDDFGDVLNEMRAELRDVVDLNGILIYEYDFGDGWMHELLVEKVIPATERNLHPICIAGKRACPPEDSGGVRGYEELLAILADPSHEEYEHMRSWAGAYQPEAFDLEAVNEALKAQFSAQRRRSRGRRRQPR
jgi:hypothetical protein